MLSTAIEAFLSKTSSFFSDAYSLYAIQLVTKYLRTSYHQAENLEARTAMSLASSLSGIAVSTPAGVNIGHCIAETIGPRFNIPHGLACSIALPYIVKFDTPACLDKVANITQYFSQELPLNIYDRARLLIRELKQLLLDLDIPLTLKEIGIPKDELKSIAELIVRDRQYKYGLPSINPRTITLDNVKQLLEEMWNGNI